MFDPIKLSAYNPGSNPATTTKEIMTDPKDPIQTTDSGHGNPPPKDKKDQNRAPEPVEDDINSLESGHGNPPPKEQAN